MSHVVVQANLDQMRAVLRDRLMDQFTFEQRGQTMRNVVDLRNGNVPMRELREAPEAVLKLLLELAFVTLAELEIVITQIEKEKTK